MSAPQFTPGPWRWTDKPGYRSLVQSEHGLIVDLLKGKSKRADGEREANARLIAAAPALYEACVEALAFVEAMEGTLDKHFLIGGIIYSALAKARGQ